MRLHRREFLATGIGAAALLVSARAFGLPVASDEPYGPLRSSPDANGLFLPEGFKSRVVAVSGEDVAGYQWHTFPDGGATYPTRGGGWIYVSNSELPAPEGGVGALKFAKGGDIVDAYRILSDTGLNCSGGATPWRTWLSCEEQDGGHVWECDPTKESQGVELPALGTFSHEAAAVDPAGKAVYLTEDDPDSRLYRFLPDEYPDLSAGLLQAAMVDEGGSVTWKDTSPDEPDRSPETAVFRRGEGMTFDRGRIIFTTTTDGRVWSLRCKTQQLDVIYDPATSPGASLGGVDNVVVHRPSGDVLVCEDGDNLEIGVLAGTRSNRSTVAPLLRVAGPTGSELAGAAFSPDGSRLYFSSQRGTTGSVGGPGITFEVRGPFRRT